MARLRPIETGLTAFGPCALMAPAWPKLRSKGRAVAAYRGAFAECEGRAAPAERGTERAAVAISLSRPRPSGAEPSGAANHHHPRTLQASAALAAAATLARPIRRRQSRSICRPQGRATKKDPGEVQTPPRRGLSVKAIATPSDTWIIPHFPGFVKTYTATPEDGPSPWGGRWVGLLPRSLALHLGGVAQQAADNWNEAKNSRPRVDKAKKAW